MKALIYIIAFVCGLFIRSAISAVNGWSYSINGVDLLCGLACITMVWSLKGIFLKPNKPNKKRRNDRW